MKRFLKFLKTLFAGQDIPPEQAPISEVNSRDRAWLDREMRQIRESLLEHAADAIQLEERLWNAEETYTMGEYELIFTAYCAEAVELGDALPRECRERIVKLGEAMMPSNVLEGDEWSGLI